MGELNIRIQNPQGMLVTVFGIDDLKTGTTNCVPFAVAGQRKYETAYRRISGKKPIQLPMPKFERIEINDGIATGYGELDGKPFELTVDGITVGEISRSKAEETESETAVETSTSEPDTEAKKTASEKAPKEEHVQEDEDSSASLVAEPVQEDVDSLAPLLAAPMPEYDVSETVVPTANTSEYEKLVGEMPPTEDVEHVTGEFVNTEPIHDAIDGELDKVLELAEELVRQEEPTSIKQESAEASGLKRPSLKSFKPGMSMGTRHTTKDQITRAVIGRTHTELGAKFGGKMPEPHVPNMRPQPIVSRGVRRPKQNQKQLREETNKTIQPTPMEPVTPTKTFEERAEDLMRLAETRQAPKKSTYTTQPIEPASKKPEPEKQKEDMQKEIFDAYQKQILEDAAKTKQTVEEPKAEEPVTTEASSVLDEMPKDVAEIISEVPTILLGNIEEYSITNVDLEDVEAGGESYCIDHRWKSKRRWFATDEVTTASRLLYSKDRNKAYRVSVALCKAYLRSL